MQTFIHHARSSASFRDPSGFLFFQEGLIYRQVNRIYKDYYDHLIQSGLYKRLVEEGLLIPHTEKSPSQNNDPFAYKILQPEVIPFISYPYEWCFSQLKDAALVTLGIQKAALGCGMSLKDSSAYNIQFRSGKPVFIDTLSFEKYSEGKPWVAYKQFCQHFLAPLSLMAYTDIRLNQLLRVHIDGIPLDLTSALLPLWSWFRFPIFLHIHLHAKSQKRFADKQVKASATAVSRHSLLALLDSLESAIRRLKWQPQDTEWANYYGDTNYASESLKHKKQLVAGYLKEINPESVWDFGANTGMFSRLASDNSIQTIAFDVDPAAVEKNYLDVTNKRETHILPLCLDLTNPSAGLGWDNQERMSLLERGPADTILALAILHHLTISNNVPFEKIADSFSKLCHSLIIEFIPKSDSQVQRLLATREDIFSQYTRHDFEEAFKSFFNIIASNQIRGSERVLYWMKKHS
jgi:hypothetical protein